MRKFEISESPDEVDASNLEGAAEAGRIGWLDSVSSGRAVGWACDPLELPKAPLLELLVNGVVVEAFQPDIIRPDIIALGHPGKSHGFDVALPRISDTNQVEISVRFAKTGEILNNSPQTPPPSTQPMQVGYFDRLDYDCVEGWAIDHQIWPQPARLKVLVDGVAVADIEPDVMRLDLLGLGLPPGAYGFRARIPELSRITERSLVAIQFTRTSQILSHSPKLYQPPSGCLVEIEGADLIGWVKPASGTTIAAPVDVLVDGGYAGTTWANHQLDPWTFPDQPEFALGFRFRLPDRYRTRRYRMVSMQFAGSGLPLENSPRQVRWAAAPGGNQLAVVTPEVRERERLPIQVLDRHGSLPIDKAAAAGVVIQAVFSESGAASPTVRAITAELRQLGFAVAIINNTAPANPVADCELASCCDLLLHKTPGGRDFGAWYGAVPLIAEAAPSAKCHVFINDSVVGPVRPLSIGLDAFRKDGSDLWAMSDSLQTAYHLQSSIFCTTGSFFFSSAFQDIVNRYPFPDDKESVILCGEIDLTQTALREGARVGCLAPYGALVARWLDWSVERLRELKAKKREKSTLRCDIAHEIKWLEQIRAGIFAGQLMNPQHHFWNTLISDFDYPFLKREMLAHNPAQVPVNEQLWETVSGMNQEEVHRRIMHELIFHGCSKFILPPRSAPTVAQGHVL